MLYAKVFNFFWFEIEGGTIEALHKGPPKPCYANVYNLEPMWPIWKYTVDERSNSELAVSKARYYLLASSRLHQERPQDFG